MYARKFRLPISVSENVFFIQIFACFSDQPSSFWYSPFSVRPWMYAGYWRVLKSCWITESIFVVWNMLVFMWVHYHPAQLGFSEFTLNDLTSHDEGDEQSMVGFFYCGNGAKRRHVHKRLLIHIWWSTSTQAYACHVRRLTLCWLLRRHANMLTCQCDAYYGCLWRWKLTFSMVFCLMWGDDTDYKSTWSAYSVMAYYTPFNRGFALQW